MARRGRGFAVPVVITGLLVAGCGTVHASSSPAAPAPAGAGAASSASSSASSGSVSAAPPSAAPVPAVTGGPVIAGQAACTGWPASAPHGRLTALFGVVAVERCVTGYQKGPGKALWETATLERATKNLTPLVTALLAPSTGRQPNTVCPFVAIIPPQMVLFSSSGKKLIPRIPITGCGQVQSRILAALSALTWQPVSVRLLTKVTGVQPGTVTVWPSSPKTIQTLPAS